MIATPWGDVQELPELDQDAAFSNGGPTPLAQRMPRERLYAAMIAACAQRGYEETTVTELLAISGVSRATFYEYFDNKAACFVATLEAVLEEVVAELAQAFDTDLPRAQQARECLRGLIEMVSTQPATARLCLVEPYVVGEAAMETMRGTVEALRLLAREALKELRGSDGMPEEISQAIVGGIRHILFRRVYAGELEGLAELEQPLWDWVLSYEPPPRPLRLKGRRPKPTPHDGSSAFAAHYPAERIVRGFASAVAEKGYPSTTISDISGHAAISQRTFYEYFDGKYEALMAALDSSGMQTAAAVLPAIRRSPGWPDSVRAAFGALCAFFVAEPDLARLREVAVYAAGPEAIAQRDKVGTQIFGEIFTETEGPDVDPMTRDAVVGALYSVMHRRIRMEGTESMPEIAPLMTFITLAPLLGAEQACEVANGDGLRRSAR